MDIIDGIAFIGLDSMEEELDGLDGLGADGELGIAQRQALDDLLTNDAQVSACHY